jgi:thioredoxin 1
MTSSASTYSPSELDSAEIAHWSGAAVLDFGVNWCGYCQAAQPSIDAAFANHPEVRHVKIEDGKGRRLGRSFQVKLWPTLIFLKDGREIARVVRPDKVEVIEEAFARLAH